MRLQFKKYFPNLKIVANFQEWLLKAPVMVLSLPRTDKQNGESHFGQLKGNYSKIYFLVREIVIVSSVAERVIETEKTYKGLWSTCLYIGNLL